MAAARLKEMQDLNLLKTVVQMNDLDIVRYGEAGKYCLATKDLNSCHAVAIIPKKAAILAHIAPLAPEAIRNNFASGDEWIKSMMTKVINCFKSNKSYFDSQESGGIVVFSMYEGKVALHDQVKILAVAVKNIIGVPTKPVSYKVLASTEPCGSNKGVVLIEGPRSRQLPIFWVEDKQVLLPVSGSSATQSTSTAVQ